MKTASKVLVIGAGTIGAGIAQIPAPARHRALLFDLRTDAANEARAKLAQTLDALVGTGKLESNTARDTLAHIVLRTALPAFERLLALKLLGFPGADGREGLAALSEQRSPRFTP